MREKRGKRDAVASVRGGARDGARAFGVASALATALPWIPVALSVFFLFRFAPPYRAVLLLLALLAHEGGHFAALFLVGAGASGIRPVSGGFRILCPTGLSYRAECLVSLAGPAANLIPGLLFCLFEARCAYAVEAGRIFVGTGLSNLIPISDHDGGRALLSCLSPLVGDARAAKVASALSFFSLFLSLTVSLAMLYVFGAGFYFSVFCLFSLLSHPV